MSVFHFRIKNDMLCNLYTKSTGGGPTSSNLRISPKKVPIRLLHRILPVFILPKEPISPNSGGRLRFLSQINYSASWRVMNDGIFQDWISQIYFFEFLFGCVWLSTEFYTFWYSTSFEPLVKLPIKLKTFKIMTSFSTPTRFSFLTEILNFCSYMDNRTSEYKS